MLLLLPVYQPGAHLPALIDEIRAAVPDLPIVVVDDGSDDTRVVDSLTGCTVLKHRVNLGKGTALKTGLREAAALGGTDVVCADADGQHSVDDILRVAARCRETRRMVLGARRIDDQMPLRSRFGNTVTQALFRAATGREVQDTQTGLRAYPADLLDWLLAVPGEQFEYEMNVLLYAARDGHPIEQVEIATTYLEDNASSHFGSITDAVRVYRPLLRYATTRVFAGSLTEPAR
ncbi:MAG TPA: glycosyltransferase family 2 protein [Actinoplanes sp.]